MSVPATEMTPAAPAATPTPSAPAGGDTGGGGAATETVDQHVAEFIQDGDDDASATPPAKAAVSPTPPAQPAAVVAPAAPPAATPTPVVPSAPAATPPAAATAQPGATAPGTTPAAAPAAAPAQDWRPKAMAALEQHYALPAEVGEQLVADPSQMPKVLTKLAAQLHMSILEAAVGGLATTLPKHIEGYLAQERANVEAKDLFYKRWPMLDHAKHGEAVLRAATQFRVMNPKATREQVIEFVGAQMLVQLGLNPGQTPAALPVAGATVPVMAPDRPAFSGGAVVPASAPSGGPDADLRDVIEDDDK